MSLATAAASAAAKPSWARPLVSKNTQYCGSSSASTSHLCTASHTPSTRPWGGGACTRVRMAGRAGLQRCEAAADSDGGLSSDRPQVSLQHSSCCRQDQHAANKQTLAGRLARVRRPPQPSSRHSQARCVISNARRAASQTAHLQAAAHTALKGGRELRVQRSSGGIGHHEQELSEEP